MTKEQKKIIDAKYGRFEITKETYIIKIMDDDGDSNYIVIDGDGNELN